VYGKEWGLLDVRKLDVLSVSETKKKRKEVQDMQGGCLALWSELNQMNMVVRVLE
jgi:hypothetical protein